MTRACPEAPATHFRLKPETWAIIAEEYKNGAMAKDLGAKWKVSATTIYRYACRDGWTKKSMGDARARAHARMVEEEEAAHRSLTPVGSRALKALFVPAPVDDPESSDPAALAKAAILASGRAMKGRLWSEAKALAGLAESYGRLADRATAEGMNAYNVPLRVVAEVLDDAGGTVSDRLKIGPYDVYDPDLPVKTLWRDRRLMVEERVLAGQAAGLSEDEAWTRALALEPPPGRRKRS